MLTRITARWARCRRACLARGATRTSTTMRVRGPGRRTPAAEAARRGRGRAWPCARGRAWRRPTAHLRLWARPTSRPAAWRRSWGPTAPGVGEAEAVRESCFACRIPSTSCAAAQPDPARCWTAAWPGRAPPLSRAATGRGWAPTCPPRMSARAPRRPRRRARGIPVPPRQGSAASGRRCPRRRGRRPFPG